MRSSTHSSIARDASPTSPATALSAGAVHQSVSLDTHDGTEKFYELTAGAVAGLVGLAPRVVRERKQPCKTKP